MRNALSVKELTSSAPLSVAKLRKILHVTKCFLYFICCFAISDVHKVRASGALHYSHTTCIGVSRALIGF